MWIWTKNINFFIQPDLQTYFHTEWDSNAWPLYQNFDPINYLAAMERSSINAKASKTEPYHHKRCESIIKSKEGEKKHPLRFHESSSESFCGSKWMRHRKSFTAVGAHFCCRRAHYSTHFCLLEAAACTLAHYFVPNTETNTSVRYALCTNTAQCYMQAPWWMTNYSAHFWRVNAHWTLHGHYSAHFNLLDYWIVLFCNFIQFIHLSRFLQTELWVQSTMQWCLSLWTGPVSSCLITTPYTSQSAPLSLGFPPFTYRIHQSLPVPLSLWWFLPFYIRLTVDCSAACFFNHNSIAIVIFFWCLEVYTCDILFPSIFLRLKHFLQRFFFSDRSVVSVCFFGAGYRVIWFQNGALLLFSPFPLCLRSFLNLPAVVGRPVTCQGRQT